MSLALTDLEPSRLLWGPVHEARSAALLQGWALLSRGCSHMCSEEGNCKLIFISLLEENLNSAH